MFLVDLEERRVVKDEELKQKLASAHSYQIWLKEEQITWEHLGVSHHKVVILAPKKKELIYVTK